MTELKDSDVEPELEDAGPAVAKRQVTSQELASCWGYGVVLLGIEHFRFLFTEDALRDFTPSYLERGLFCGTESDSASAACGGACTWVVNLLQEMLRFSRSRKKDIKADTWVRQLSRLCLSRKHDFDAADPPFRSIMNADFHASTHAKHRLLMLKLLLDEHLSSSDEVREETQIEDSEDRKDFNPHAIDDQGNSYWLFYSEEGAESMFCHFYRERPAQFDSHGDQTRATHFETLCEDVDKLELAATAALADHKHPEAVRFMSELREDVLPQLEDDRKLLLRRDRRIAHLGMGVAINLREGRSRRERKVVVYNDGSNKTPNENEVIRRMKERRQADGGSRPAPHPGRAKGRLTRSTAGAPQPAELEDAAVAAATAASLEPEPEFESETKASPAKDASGDGASQDAGGDNASQADDDTSVPADVPLRVGTKKRGRRPKIELSPEQRPTPAPRVASLSRSGRGGLRRAGEAVPPRSAAPGAAAPAAALMDLSAAALGNGSGSGSVGGFALAPAAVQQQQPQPRRRAAAASAFGGRGGDSPPPSAGGDELRKSSRARKVPRLAGMVDVDSLARIDPSAFGQLARRGGRGASSYAAAASGGDFGAEFDEDYDMAPLPPPPAAMAATAAPRAQLYHYQQQFFPPPAALSAPASAGSAAAAGAAAGAGRVADPVAKPAVQQVPLSALAALGGQPSQAQLPQAPLPQSFQQLPSTLMMRAQQAPLASSQPLQVPAAVTQPLRIAPGMASSAPAAPQPLSASLPAAQPVGYQHLPRQVQFGAPQAFMPQQLPAQQQFASFAPSTLPGPGASAVSHFAQQPPSAPSQPQQLQPLPQQPALGGSQPVVQPLAAAASFAAAPPAGAAAAAAPTAAGAPSQQVATGAGLSPRSAAQTGWRVW